MSEESTSTAIAEVAAERYGDRYHGETHGSLPASTRAPLKSAREAVSAVKESSKKAAPRAPERTQEPADSVPEGRWSDQDLADLDTFRVTAEQATQAARQFAARYQLSLSGTHSRSFEELQARDPAEAVALQHDFRPVWQAAQLVAQMEQSITAELNRRQLVAAAGRLHQELPDLDKPALMTYLRKRFTEAELSTVEDERLVVLAEKARRWDEQAKKQPKRSPKKVKRTTDAEHSGTVTPLRHSSNEDDLRARLRRGGMNRSDALELLYATREAKR